MKKNSVWFITEGRDMTEMKFNLLDEPWIRVMGENCALKEVSITEALINAHRYSALAGETPAQDVAILRLLIAIVHTVFYRVDESGRPAMLVGYDDALDRWEALWHAGALPETPIRSYLDTWHDRFDLLDPDRPFYQVPEAKIGTPHTAAKLNGTILQSENKIRVFSGRTADTKGILSFAEAARWLIYLHCFDDAGVKKKTEAGKKNAQVNSASPKGWLGNLGVIYALGGNLFQTLLLNLCFLRDGAELYAPPKPCWELEMPNTEERTLIFPDNLPALFTLQSRRVLLVCKGEHIIGFNEYCGDLIESSDAFQEPMTLWALEQRNAKRSSYTPKRHSDARQLWRDFSTIVVVSENCRLPGVTYWLLQLQENNCLENDRPLRFTTVGVEYDKNASSSVEKFIHDSLSFHADLLTEIGGVWQLRIKDQIEYTDKVAYHLSVLAGELATAAGKRETKKIKGNKYVQMPAHLMKAAEAAKAQYYHRVDEAFRKWLLKPEAGQNAEMRDELCSEWKETAVRIAREVAREEIDRAGPPAMTGRWVETEKNGAATKRHYSAAEAYNRFDSRMKKLMEGGT